MSGGQKSLLWNSLERAISDDNNRAEAFSFLSQNEFARYLVNVSQGTDDVDAAGLSIENLSTNSPVDSIVIGGLLVNPQIASTSCTVSAGLVMMINPDTSPPQDSNSSYYKYVQSAGIQSLGVLTLTPNSSGQTRIDVVECSRNPNSGNIEVDSRDQFSISSGIFNPVSVTKVQSDELSYRIRIGTPGSGFPGTTSGWLPLMVMSVPTGTTTFDTVTCWDVRPLLGTRAFGLSNISLAVPYLENCNINAIDMTTPTPATGHFKAILGNQRIGGRLRRGSPGTDADSIDITNAANQDGAYSFNHNAPFYLYACLPLGLPTWARYTDASSSVRKPRSPRGIVLLSNVACDANGQATSSLSFPTAFGLTGSTITPAQTVCIAAGFTSNAFSSPTQIFGFIVEDKNVFIFDGAGGAYGAGPTSGATLNLTLTPGTHFPANAKDLKFQFDCAGTGTINTNSYLNYSITYPASGSYVPFLQTTLPIPSSGQLTIPIPSPYPSTTQQNIKITMEVHNTTSPQLEWNIYGWKI